MLHLHNISSVHTSLLVVSVSVSAHHFAWSILNNKKYNCNTMIMSIPCTLDSLSFVIYQLYWFREEKANHNYMCSFWLVSKPTRNYKIKFNKNTPTCIFWIHENCKPLKNKWTDSSNINGINSVLCWIKVV